MKSKSLTEETNSNRTDKPTKEETEAKMVWVRICQKCRHKQITKPGTNLTPKEFVAYQDQKCRECESTALDFGSYRPSFR